jgi:hypothetical protein
MKMKRQKTYFADYQECAHVWAAQTQPAGHSRGRKVFFDGPRIWSYGTHFEMARFVKVGRRPGQSVVLFTTREYSSTTAGHKWAVRRAVDGQPVFTVPSFENHNENASHYLEKIGTAIAKLKRSHGPAGLGYIQSEIKEAAGYVNFFGRKIKAAHKKKLAAYLANVDVILSPAELATLERRELALKERNEKRDAARREKWRLYSIESRKRNIRERWERRARRRADKVNLAADLERWKNGENVDNSLLYDSPIMLRINEAEKEIETSRDANVPLIEARKFWHKLQSRENVIGMRLGYYTVDAIDGSTLRVGCHKIPLREVYKMARLLKWDSEPVGSDGAALEVLQ